MKISKCVKVSFVFIGTIIGAGFATGGEVLLYFGDASIFSPLFSSVVAYFLAITFLQSKKRVFKLSKLAKTMDVLIYFATVVSFMAMTACFDELLYSTLKVKFLGVIPTFLCYLALRAKFDGLGAVNSVAVPMIIAMLVFVFIRSGFAPQSGDFGVKNAVLYATMNFMTSGCVLAYYGENMSKSEVSFTGFLCATETAFALLIVWNIVKGSDCAMPVVERAQELGLGYLSAPIVFFAVLTTQISNVKVIIQKTKEFRLPEVPSFAFFVLVCIVSIALGFDNVIKNLYPVIGITGVIYVVYVLICSAKSKAIKRKIDGRHMPIRQ